MHGKPFIPALVFWCSTFSALAQQPDISVDHIEFVQVAQDHDNTVPLVAGKSTVARVFLGSAGSSDITSGISGSLTADGFPEMLRPFGDLPVIAPAGTPDPNNQRHSLNFLLPPAWTRVGDLQVRATARLNAGPEKLLPVSATFQAAPNWPAVFRVLHLEICAPDAGGKKQCASNLGEPSELMQRVYPLADGAVEYNPVQGSIDWPGDLLSPAGQIRFTRFLIAYYHLIEQSAPVDQLLAWVPFGGGAQALASGLGHVWWDTDSGPVNNAAALARGVGYNLGLRDGDWLAPETFQTLFQAQALAPAATQASTVYVVNGGTVSPDGSVAKLDPGYRVTSSRPGAPSDPNGTHCLRFSSDTADYCFTPFFADAVGGFQVKAPVPAGATRVALIRDGAELATITASGSAPAISIVSPRVGDTWQGQRTIEWTGSDLDGNPLVYAVQYSADNAASWIPLAIDLKDTRYEVDGARIWGGSQVLFRVLASNGLNTATAVAGPVTVTQSPKLALDQTALDFLNGAVGQSADRTLLLTNSGSGPLTASARISAGPYRLLSSGGSLVIPAGGQRAITVRWTPTSAGSQPGTLALTSSDPSLATVNIALSGTALDSMVPAIRLGASSLNFGNVNLGQTKDLTLTIGNGGAGTLTVSSITSGSSRFSIVAPALPLAIPAGQSANVTVRFSPNAAGVVSGALSITSNDPAQPTVTVALSGTGAAGLAPSISVTPASLDFGSVNTGQIKDATLTLGNAGSADLTVSSITSSAAGFTVSLALPITIVPGRSVDITVRFAPPAAGPVSATLTIASNDPARPNLAVSLTGAGLAPAVSSVLRTIAYHEITALGSPIDVYNIPVISRSGNRAAFTVKTTDLWVVNADGTGATKVDANMTPNAHFLSISDDGAKVLVWNASFLRIVNADGSGGATILTSADGAVQGARLSGDGKTIAFINGHGAGSLAVGGSVRIAERGIWSINSDGTGLRGVVAGRDVAGLLGIGDIVGTGADSSFPSGIDVSFNGSRIVFGVDAGTKGRVVLGVNADGSGVHVIRAGLSRMFATALSGDGSTVAYLAPAELGVARFDGSGGVSLAAPSGLFGLQVSNDGSLAFAGGAGNGLLWRTDGSRLVELFAPLFGSGSQLAYENGALNRASMTGDGARFLFTTPGLRYAQDGTVELAMVEINPSNFGAAPVIANPTVDPTSIPSDGAGYRANITARVTSSSPVSGASAVSFLQGLAEPIGTTMTDTGGGVWAGSLFFSTSVSGPRILRVKAETQAPDGKRHATAIDFGGFSVR